MSVMFEACSLLRATRENNDSTLRSLFSQFAFFG